ncbi:protein of unknown function [Streptomyces sp. KY75]|nr:protein of unknown function [Streptomyces sp. KY75]
MVGLPLLLPLALVVGEWTGGGGGGHRKPAGRCAGQGVASAGGRRDPRGWGGQGAQRPSGRRPSGPGPFLGVPGPARGLCGRSAGFSSRAVPQLSRVVLGVLTRAVWLRCLPGPNVRCERQSDKGGDGGGDMRGDIGGDEEGDKGGDTKEQRRRSFPLVSSRIVCGEWSDFPLLLPSPLWG